MQERRFSLAEISTGHPSCRIRLMGARFAAKNAEIQPFYTPSNQDTMGDGHGCTLSSAPTGDAAVLDGQIALLAMGSRVGDLDQETSQPGIALAGLATCAFARAFVISWTDPSPRCQMASRRRLAHVQTDFCQDPLGGSLTTAWNTAKQLHGLVPTEQLGCSAAQTRLASLD